MKRTITVILCFLASMNTAATSEEIIFNTLSCNFNLTAANQAKPQTFLFNSCSWQQCHLWTMNPQFKKCINHTIQAETSWQNCMHHCCDDATLGYSFETLNQCYYNNKPTNVPFIIFKCLLAVLIVVVILAGIIAYCDRYIPKKYKNSMCSLCNKPGVNLVFDSCGTHYFHRECVVSNTQKTLTSNCPTCSRYSSHYRLYCKTCGYKKENGRNYSSIFKNKTDFCNTCANKDKKE